MQKSDQLEKKVADGKPRAVEDRIFPDFEQQMQAVLKSQKPAHQKMLLYNEMLRKSKVYKQKRRARCVQKKEKLSKKEILKHFKKSKNKEMKRILDEIESHHNLDWNSIRNLVLDGRRIPSSNITELLRSAVIKKEPNIPSWSAFDKTLKWKAF